ncbi:MAG: hypothetical protein Q7J85_09370 [Bacillota bacterium]|nr:hypothetical protein [Bacillota bacterium]
MKKARGVVLESTRKYVILLAPGGEYLKIPTRGRVFTPGSQVEIELTPSVKKVRVFALVASIMLLIALTFTMQVVTAQPEAYLALDINPSIFLSLNKKTEVIRAEALNSEAEDIISSLDLKGRDVSEAIELLLVMAYQMDYLSLDKDNTIFVTLAAPGNYRISEEDLRVSISEQILEMELNSYLMIATTDPREAEEARGAEISLNAMMLGKQMAERGLIEDNVKPDGPGPPPPVREFLKIVQPDKIFEENEFVRGRSDEKRPDHAVGPKQGRLADENKEDDNTDNLEEPTEGGSPDPVGPPAVVPANQRVRGNKSGNGNGN